MKAGVTFAGERQALDVADGKAAGSALCIERLTLTDFRNYSTLRLELDPGLIVLTGPNGAGKTNLLEAVSLLVPGRGMRNVVYEDLRRAGAKRGWAVSSHVAGPGGEMAIGTGWQPASPAGEDRLPQSRKVSIEQVMQKSSNALGLHMRILWLTPAMDRLFAGPASERRKFFDRLVAAFDPGQGARVQLFERLMRERNRMLQEAAIDDAWISGVEEQLAEAGVAVAAARITAVAALRGLIDEMRSLRAASAFPWADIAIEGALECCLAEQPAVQVEDEYRKILRDSRKLDQAAGRTLNGPHRSDFTVVHGPKAVAAKSCSTGEQKALLVGMVLAHARAVRGQFDGWVPVLLLDEVAAHLDEERRAALMDEIGALGCQAWMTGTDQSLFRAAGGRARFFDVANAVVTDAPVS